MGTKEKIVNEYLGGTASIRELAKKYGFSRSSIHRLILKSGKEAGTSPKILEGLTLPAMDKSEKTETLPEDVGRLREELAQERLRNKLLTAMIEVAEDELKIPIRKKYGTKPLKK